MSRVSLVTDRPRVAPLRGLAAARFYWQLFADPIGCLTHSLQVRGPVCLVGNLFERLGRERKYVVGLGPEYNRQVLSNPQIFANPGQFVPGPRDSAMERIRAGLTQMNGDKYRSQRQLLLPLFTPSAIQGYAEQIKQVTRDEVAGWPLDKPVNMWDLLRRLTLRISARVLFGRIDPERADMLGELTRDWIRRSFSPAAWLIRLNWRGLPYRELILHAERLERELLALIRERRQGGAAVNPDMLDLLMDARDDEFGGMTDTDLVGQAAILFTAGFETQTNALSWSLYLLAQHPEVMADLHDELAGTLAGEQPTIAQLSRMPLLDAALKESLRILPPVPFTLRKVNEAAELGGVPLAIGDRVICSHYVTHHMPELYEDPERFHPERWQTIKPSSYEYLPFSAGPRYCIGASLATTTMKIVLATVLQKLRVAVVPGARIDRAVRITMNPKFGMPMVLHAQDRNFQAAEVRGNIHEMVDHTPRPVILTFPAVWERGEVRVRRAA